MSWLWPIYVTTFTVNYFYKFCLYKKKYTKFLIRNEILYDFFYIMDVSIVMILAL